MYYRLEFVINTFEYQEISNFFYFKNRIDAENKLKELNARCYARDELYKYWQVENVYKGYISEISFEELKEEITVEDFEELFNIQIEEPKN